MHMRRWPRLWPAGLLEPATQRLNQWQRVLDVLLPPRCVGCGRRGYEVCDQCLAELRPLGPEQCPRCAAPSRGGRICSRCGGQPEALRAILAQRAFEGTTRAAILAVKYRGRTRLVPFLASGITQALETRPLTIDVVVPVPLAAGRLRTRGFNQSELLAREVSSKRGLPIEVGALIRNRETEPQTRLSARERRRNVQGAFAATQAESVAERRILLVDDVCTTGATLGACAIELMAAGAAGVWGAVAARELPHR